MPELEYFLVARAVVIDQFTNAVSVHSVVDEVTPRRFPLVLMRLTALIGLNVERAEFGHAANYRVVVRIPGEREALESKFNFSLEWSRHRYAPAFIGVRVTQPGDIGFTLFVNDREVAHHRVLVHDPDPGVSPDGWLMYESDEPRK